LFAAEFTFHLFNLLLFNFFFSLFLYYYNIKNEIFQIRERVLFGVTEKFGFCPVVDIKFPGKCGKKAP
jgi:hypothetical protein